MSEKLTFDDVLNEVLLEESEPTYEALQRWTKRYPKYRDDLASFFATWGVQAVMPETATIDEEKLVKKGVEYALEIARRQGRIESRTPVESLAPFDQMVLAAVYLLHGDGEAVNISERVSEMSGTRVLIGSTLVSLNRLEQSGLVMSRLAEAEEDGDETTYYVTTLAGDRALARARESSKLLTDFLGDFA